ncbi:hypothetical protein AcW1_007038 [Taiwanofungus camphoratus]|nr:hypothetical protein AcW1_007038 [Antrodia cinnamomea]
MTYLHTFISLSTLRLYYSSTYGSETWSIATKVLDDCELVLVAINHDNAHERNTTASRRPSLVVQMAPAFTPTSHPTGSHSTAGDLQVTGTPSIGTSSSRMSGGTSSGRPAPYSVPDARGSQTQAQVEAL